MNFKVPIQLLARQKGLTGRDLAKTIGLTEPHLSRLLSGQIPMRIDYLKSIADILEIPVWKIVRAAEIIKIPDDEEEIKRLYLD